VQDVVELFEGLCGLPPLPIMISSHHQCLNTCWISSGDLS
jgi:hypothetical protein